MPDLYGDCTANKVGILLHKEVEAEPDYQKPKADEDGRLDR